MATDRTIELFLPLDRLRILEVKNTLPDGRAISWLAEEKSGGRQVLVRSVDAPIDDAYDAWLHRADWLHWGRLTEIKRGEDHCYLVREWIDGVSLSGLIGDGTAVVPELPTRVMFARIARLLARLHHEREVHGRLKPGNVIINGSTIHLVDPESNAHARRGSVGEMTQEFHVTGDLHYLSPEQLRGHRPTPASDVYTLGCMLYEALVGRPPFGHANPVMLCSLHFTADPEPLWRFRSDLTDRTEMLIRKCLAKDPQVRFQSAVELEHALLLGIEGQESELAMAEKYEESMNLLSRLERGRKPAPPVAAPEDRAPADDSALLAELRKQQEDAAAASEPLLQRGDDEAAGPKASPSRTSQLSRGDIRRALEMARAGGASLPPDPPPLPPAQPAEPRRDPDVIQPEDWELIRPPYEFPPLEPMESFEGLYAPEEEDGFLLEESQPFQQRPGAGNSGWQTAFFIVLIYAFVVTLILIKQILTTPAAQ
jgi:serine/threonine protein kinase